MATAEPPPANVTRLLVLANAIVAILMGFAGSNARDALLFWAGLVPARLTLALDGQLPALGAAPAPVMVTAATDM